MKKFFVSIVLILGVMAASFWGLQHKINTQISTEIEKLNNNGFIVKNEQTTNYIKTSANGYIQVAYPDKVASFVFGNIPDKELKEAIQEQYNLLDINEKESFFEGINFDYDFVIENFTQKLDFNIFFTKLSKKVMYNLEQDTENQDNKWLLELLKNKKLHVNINEKKEYKVSDIETILPQDEVMLTIRGFRGNEKQVLIDLFKITNADLTQKGFLLIKDINVDYIKEENKQTSKTLIKNIEFQENEDSFNIKNLVLNSIYEKNQVNINSKSEFGFDEVLAKIDSKNINLQKSFITFDVANLPIDKIDQMSEYLINQDFDSYLRILSQAGVTVNSKAEALNYEFNKQKFFETLKFDLSLKLKNKLPEENLKDASGVFETAKLVIDLDEKTALNLKTLLTLKQQNVEPINLDNNLKRFEVILKDEGLHINNQLFFENKALVIPSKNKIDKTKRNLSYEYKMINENLLKLDVKYSSGMQNISDGAILISFPELKDKTRIINNTTDSLQFVDFYEAQSELFDNISGQSIKSSYLLVEAWDDVWAENEEKTISLSIDVEGLDNLKVYLRAEAINELDSSSNQFEQIPEEGFLDEQNYPVQVLEISIPRVK